MSDQSKAEKVVPFAVPPIVKTVSVRCAPEQAFRLFTDHIGAWWPVQTAHIGPDPEIAVLETRVGGRLYERAKDGRETVWGTVRAWEPPHRLAFSWTPGLPDGIEQLVEVTFVPSSDGATVTLTHTGWEQLGELAAERQRNFTNGWARIFELAYRDYANGMA